MLMTQSAVPALVQSQDSGNDSFNPRKTATTGDAFGLVASEAAATASLQRTTGDRHYEPSSSFAAAQHYVRSQGMSTTATTMAMNGNGMVAGMPQQLPPQSNLYVRALYDYEADDRTSLSFHEGDIIQVITQLESGWWDGVINGVRGWFPSNYCEIITDPNDLPDGFLMQTGDGELVQEEEQEEEPVYEEDQYDEEDEEDEEDDLDHEDGAALPLEGTRNGDRAAQASAPDYWIPQATADGRLYYYNTMTGQSRAELPLESPTEVNETGPRDRMNVGMPEKTRPPPEMMARGLTNDEDEDSEANSASELEGESLMLASKGTLVSAICLIFLHSDHVLLVRDAEA